jgi:tetratricopeptide (TPR) repeat protein
LEAARSYKNAIVCGLKSESVFCSYGAALNQLGHTKEAIIAFKYAIPVSPPGSCEAQIAIAEIHFVQKAYAEAAEFFEAAIGIDPIAKTYTCLGNAQYHLGETEKAVLSYERSLDLDPENENTHYSLGVVRSAKGLPALALRSFLKALSINPQFVDARCYLGTVLETQGEYLAAIKACQTAVQSIDTIFAAKQTTNKGDKSISHLVITRQQATDCTRRCLNKLKSSSLRKIKGEGDSQSQEASAK